MSLFILGRASCCPLGTSPSSQKFICCVHCVGPQTFSTSAVSVSKYLTVSLSRCSSAPQLCIGAAREVATRRMAETPQRHRNNTYSRSKRSNSRYTSTHTAATETAVRQTATRDGNQRGSTKTNDTIRYRGVRLGNARYSSQTNKSKKCSTGELHWSERSTLSVVCLLACYSRGIHIPCLLLLFLSLLPLLLGCLMYFC